MNTKRKNMITELHQLVGPNQEKYGYTILRYGDEKEAYVFHYSPLREIEGEVCSYLESSIRSAIHQQGTFFYIDTTLTSSPPQFEEGAKISIPTPLNIVYVNMPHFGKKDSWKESWDELSVPYMLGHKKKNVEKKLPDFYLVTRRSQSDVYDLLQEMSIEKATIESRLQPLMNSSPVMFEFCEPTKFDRFEYLDAIEFSDTR